MKKVTAEIIEKCRLFVAVKVRVKISTAAFSLGILSTGS